MYACPITNQVKGGSFEVQLPRGSKITGVVLSEQMRSVDWLARRAEFHAEATEDLMQEVLGRVAAILLYRKLSLRITPRPALLRGSVLQTPPGATRAWVSGQKRP